MASSTMKRVRRLTVVAVFAIVAVAAFGFAAANVVPESGAGDGDKAISGYTVTNVTYDLDGTNPSLIDEVSFDLAPSAGAGAATEVQVQLVTGGTWFSCTAGVAPNWDCNIGGSVTALAANNLRVVAVQ